MSVGYHRKRHALTELFIILVLAVHFVSVHVASAGPLISAGLAWRYGRTGDHDAAVTSRWLAKASLLTLSLGALTGLVAGWLISAHSGRNYQIAVRRLATKFWWGGWELAFYVGCLCLFLAWWKWGSLRKSWQRIGHTMLPVLAGTNLLYHFPPLMIVLRQVAAADDIPADAIGYVAFRHLIYQSEILAKTFHFWGASFAVSGILMMCYGMRAPDPCTEKHGRRVVTRGARIALVATIIQLPLGVWLLAQMPPASQQSILGDDLVGTVMLLGALFAALTVLYPLVSIALGDPTSTAVTKSVVLMLLIVLLMTGTMYRANQATPALGPVLVDIAPGTKD